MFELGYSPSSAQGLVVLGNGRKYLEYVEGIHFKIVSECDELKCKAPVMMYGIWKEASPSTRN